jgi:hypothetical protein
MAIVILGGLLTSTMLNLFVVPFLYLRFGAGGAGRRLGAALPPIDRTTAESWPPRAPELIGSGGRTATNPESSAHGR